MKKAIVLFVIIINGLINVFGQSIYTWSPTTTDWTLPTNWIPARTPMANDILIFNAGAYTVSNIPNETVGQLILNSNAIVNFQPAVNNTILTISGAAVGNDFVIQNGAELNVIDDRALTILIGNIATGDIKGTIHFGGNLVNTSHRLLGTDVGSIVFTTPAKFTQGYRSVGNVFGNTGTANIIVFESGTTFILDGGTILNANPFGLAQPASKVVFKSGSLYKHQQMGAISFSGRTYANFEYNYPVTTPSNTGTNPTNIDNLRVTTGNLFLDVTGGVNVKGNVSVAVGAGLNFTPSSSGTLAFMGTVSQLIINNGTLNFGINENIEFNNPAGIIFNNNVTFQNVVSFTNGIITVPNPVTLTFNELSTLANVSNNSFVDGRVKKIGNTSFAFPVGKPLYGYVPIAISAPANITDAFTAEYKRSSANALGAITAVGLLDHVSNVDYWVLERNSGTSAVDVLASWTAGSSNNGATNYINNLMDLALANYDGSTWSSYYHATGAAVGTVVAGTLTWPAVNNFGSFSFGSINFNNPLPINLNYFKANNQGNINYINWKVTCGNNNNKALMSIERSSNNQNFFEIKTISADALRCQQPFYYIDNIPIAATNFYRLKMVDDNGKITFSETIIVENKSESLDFVNLLSNNVTTEIAFNFNSTKKTTLVLVITDVSGRQVSKQNYNIVVGINKFNINVSKLSAGIYYLSTISNSGDIETVKFVKQ